MLLPYSCHLFGARSELARAQLGGDEVERFANIVGEEELVDVLRVDGARLFERVCQPHRRAVRD